MNETTSLIRATLLGAAVAGTMGAATLTRADEPAKKSPWTTTASAGLTLTSGNSDTLLFVADIKAAKKKNPYELTLGADGSYGENDGNKNNESVHGFTQFNYLFSDRFYGYARVDGLHDGIADVDYRVSLSPGAGYYFIKNDQTKLSGEVGPGVVFERLGGVEDTYMTLRVAESFEHKFNDRVRIWQSVEFLPEVSDVSNYTMNFEAGVESALTTKSKLRVYLQDTYKSEPAAGRKKNDLKLVSALAWTF